MNWLDLTDIFFQKKGKVNGLLAIVLSLRLHGIPKKQAPQSLCSKGIHIQLFLLLC